MSTTRKDNNFTKKAFLEIMQRYGESWETFDTKKLLSLFAKNAAYYETPFNEPWRGHEGIGRYWDEIVRGRQKNVSFVLGSTYVHENVGIAEWTSTFIEKETGSRKELRGVILVDVHKGKIQKLWEYWHKQTHSYMNDVAIGEGALAGKGVYANRDFEEGEVVIQYHLTPLTQEEFEQLSESEKMFTHTHWGRIMLYGEPERYVNHSDNQNTYQDLEKQQDIALRDIKKGEMITGDATKDDVE